MPVDNSCGQPAFKRHAALYDDHFDSFVTKWHDGTVPKIIGSTLAEHRAKVREKLFGALGELMEERGFEAVTLAQIAARAKVGRTSVYNHFADKEDLLLAFIEYETGHFVANLREALRDVNDPEEQLRVYVREQLMLQHGYQFTPGTDLRTVVSPETMARLREHVADVALILRNIITRGIEDGIMVNHDLDTSVQLVHSCVQAWTLSPAGPAREKEIRDVTDFVLRAVGVTQPRA